MSWLCCPAALLVPLTRLTAASQGSLGMNIKTAQERAIIEESLHQRTFAQYGHFPSPTGAHRMLGVGGHRFIAYGALVAAR